MRYRTLSNVASDLCAIHLGDPEGKGHALAMRALGLAMDELSLHINANIITEQKVIGDNYTIQMPNTCIDVLKVGVMIQGGRVRLMGRDDSIRRGVPEVSGCSCSESSTADEVSACSLCCLHNTWHGNHYLGEMYGFRPPQFPNGKFRYNDKDNRIEFSTGYDVVAGATVFIEYNAALGGPEYNLIPSAFATVLMHRAAAELKRGGEAQYHFGQFKTLYTAYKRASIPYNEFDLLAAIQGEVASAPKQ